MSDQNLALATGVTPAVGSSKNKISGSCNKEAARETCCFMPPGRSLTKVFKGFVKLMNSSNSFVRLWRVTFGIFRKLAVNAKFSFMLKSL